MPEVQASDGAAFLRQWAEVAYDKIQLAQIAAIQEMMVNYATMAWRPMTIEPPTDIVLLCACHEGLVLMTRTNLDAWRTTEGKPHKPPRAWMPCPVPPKA